MLRNYHGWDRGNYESECGKTDWLKPNNGYIWTLTPVLNSTSNTFYVYLSGFIGNNYIYNTNIVWPTLYLKATVKITPNQNSEQPYGTIDNPFQLSQSGM